MKKITTLPLAFSYVGMFLGAGFVSGQELWQFFGCFGIAGFAGFLLSAGLFLVVAYALLRLSCSTGIADIGALIFPGDHPRARAFIDILQCLLLFGIIVIMIAGAASLLHDLTGLPKALCGALFTLAVLPMALYDLQGLVAAFSVIVPVLCIAAVFLGLAVLFRQDFRFAPSVGSVSAMLPNWWIGGITYATYNLFGAIGMLVPFAALIPDTRTIRRGLGLGSVFFLVMTFGILASLTAMPASGAADLPTAMLAQLFHPALGLVFEVLMGLAMFSASVGSLIALLNQGGFHWPILQTRRKAFLVLFLLGAYALSLLGFSELIGVVYPLFGYISIPFLVLLVRNWITHKL